MILCAALNSSCSDSGCIDANDFGEYESQTLVVLSNASQESCTFDYSKDLLDTVQGSGIKPCLTAGNTTITDEAGITQSNTNDGCSGFANAKFRNLCINNCVQLCNSNSSGTSASSEPTWTSTDKKKSGKNIGVTIRPGSQIIIRAVGSVVLGDAVSYPDSYVQANNPLPHSKNQSWDDTFFDVRNSQSVFVKFSGQWNDGIDAPDAAAQLGGGPTAFGGANDSRIYNGAKRIVAFLTPHPTGYDFNISAATERDGVKGVPILPDAAAWTCSYSGNNDKKQSSCGNAVNGYVNNGYTNANDSLIATVFPVNSNFRSTILAKFGGIIRWDNDGLDDDAVDPFSANSVTCNGVSGSCANINNVLGNKGRIIGDLSAGNIEIPNNDQDAYKVSLKSLVADSGCNLTLTSVNVVNSSSVVISSLANVGVSNAIWTPQHITLEPTQKLVISQNIKTYPAGVNCGSLIAVRFAKYHDIVMEQSGFVKFTTLRGVGSCNIKGRIINPNGSSLGLDSSYTADFYEYQNFTQNLGTDPLENLSVIASPAIGNLTWSNEVFLRKGQTIRFSPESWNGEWITSNGLSRKCGIGMAMIVEPRPALLCRGKATDTINNPSCLQHYDNSGTLIGCQAISATCNAPSSSDYCITSCRRPITCSTAGTILNNFQKAGCTSGAQPSDCSYTAECLNCANAEIAAASLAAKLDINAIDQCYDLENYKGKVSNISSSTILTKADIDAFLANVAKAKGLKKLPSFNGDYGNLSSFNSTGTVDATTGNIIYQLTTPLSLTKSGRFKFFVLDGSDFNGVNGLNPSYDNNSASGGSYGGSNGFKIKLSGTLEFSNGAWLQVKLCQESNNSDTSPSVNCKSNTIAAMSGGATFGEMATQPKLVEITAPTESSPPGAPPTLTGSYKFDDSGNITRFTSPQGPNSGFVGDCTIATSGVDTIAGSLFYCHKYQYFTPKQLKAKSQNEQNTINSDIQRLRLSFKILDPEIGDCDIATHNDGIKMNNPFYDSSAGDTFCTTAEIPGNGTTQSPGTCKKQYYCANKYSNNNGKYYINVKIKNPVGGNISNIIGSVIKPVVEVMDGKKDDPETAEVNESTMGQAERVYKLLIADHRYKAILTMSLVTMFTFYGFGYLIGAVELNHADLINRIIKIGLIYLFVGETGWEWFNKIVVKFFKDSTDYLAFMMASSFDDSPELSNAIAQGQYYDKSLLFASVDKVFGLFFSSAVQKKISALLFASIFGWAYLLILYSSFMLYVYAVANAVLLYLTAQVFISVLFVLGPIFFVFTLFAQTKEMFDNWLKQLISFSLQQIFLLTTLAFFNMMMYEVIKMALGYKICWDEVWTINIVIRITLLSFWNIASLPPRTNAQSEVGNIGNPEGIPSLFTILFIWVIASLMKKFIDFMTDLAAGISSGLKASELGGGVADFAKKMKGMMGKGIGAALERSGAADVVRKLDKDLFDSGKLAEESRTKQRKQNSADLSSKSAMSKSGDKAVSDYKKKNGKELMGMTAEKQRDTLKDVRNVAMNAEGKKLGLSDDKIKDLKSDKGLKYVDTNVFGAVVQAARQKMMSGGSLNKSIEDRDVKTKFSSHEASGAMKRMTKEERGQFVEAAKQGKVEIGRNKLDTVLNSKAAIGATIVTGGAAPVLYAGYVAAKSAKKFFHDKDYDTASKELEDEKLIEKNSVGWSRKDVDKKLIRERRKDNLQERKANVKAPKADVIADLEKEARYRDDQDTISDSDSNFAVKGFKSAGKYIARGFNKVIGRDKDQTKARDETRKITRDRIKSDETDSRSALASLSANRTDAYNSFQDSEKKLQTSLLYKEMNDLDKKGRGRSPAENAQFARVQKEVKADEGLSAEIANKNKAAVAMNMIDSLSGHIDYKVGLLESAAASMDAEELAKQNNNPTNNNPTNSNKGTS